MTTKHTEREDYAAAQPQQAAPEWKMPDEPELFKFINETPILQSLLYDINLLPEQIKDPVRWGYLVSLVSHYEMAVINASPHSQKQAAPGAVLEGFEDWLCREMPAGTIIGDPKWWAPRIARAMLSAAPKPQGE